MSARDLVVAAARQAASAPYREGDRGPEANLVRTVERCLPGPTKREYRDDLVPGWKRQPGGVDLAVVQADGRARVLMEMKVDKLDESLWDIFKLAALRSYDWVEGSFLIYESTNKLFSGPASCSALFRSEIETSGHDVWSTSELVRRWPRAWHDLLLGGYGNHPMEVPARIRLSVLNPFQGAQYTGREIRVLEVTPVEGELISFDATGWPSDLPTVDRYPRPGGPAGPVATQPSPEHKSTEETRHMEFPKRISQRWLEINVPTMTPNEFEALLARLRDTNWQEDELAARVLPLRPRTDDLPQEPRPRTPTHQSPPATAEPEEQETPAAPSVPGPRTPRTTNRTLPELIKRVLPAVVQVAVESRKGGATGSGFAIDPLEGDEGRTVIITNAHVTMGGRAFGIRHGEDDFYRAKLVIEEPKHDLAILTVPIPPPATLPVRFLRDVEAGEDVIAVGSPLGLTQTVTSGIVSALGRRVGTLEEHVIQNAIQTSAPINPGNSGGPLIGMDGKVVGVNTSAPGGSTGLGFAVPAESALRLYNNARS